MSIVDIRLRIPADVKQDAEALFGDMGMTIGEAVKIFLKQSINSGGLPFKPHVKNPNAETVKSFVEIEENNYKDLTLAEFKHSLNIK